MLNILSADVQKTNRNKMLVYQCFDLQKRQQEKSL